MRKFSLLFTLLILFSTQLKAETLSCGEKSSALIISEHDKKIIFDGNSDKVAYPASLTKLMTLYLTFEAIEKKKLTPWTILTVSERGEEISHINKITTLNLEKGNKISVRDAIRAVIVKSMNGAAVTLGEAVGGDEWNFARMMNEKAQQLGMINSSFRNSTGLHEEGQYVTVYDLARLALALKKDFPGYYHLFGLKEFEFNGKKYDTHNHVLVDYKKAEGLKTGFTSASGFNLVSAAYDKKLRRRLFGIVVSCPSYESRDEFMKDVLSEGFDRLKMKENDGELSLKLKTF